MSYNPNGPTTTSGAVAAGTSSPNPRTTQYGAASQGQGPDRDLQMAQDQLKALYGRMGAIQAKLDAIRGGDISGVPLGEDDIESVYTPEMGRPVNAPEPSQATVAAYTAELQKELDNATKAFNDTAVIVQHYNDTAAKQAAAGTLTEADRQQLSLDQQTLAETIRRNDAEIARAAKQDAIDAARLDLDRAKFEADNDPADKALARAAQDAQNRLTALQGDAQAFDTQTLGPARADLVKAQTAAQDFEVKRGETLLPVEVRGGQATAAHTEAETAQINALIAAGYPEAQARSMVAQARLYGLQGDTEQVNLEHLKAGELATYHQQLYDGIANGTYTEAEADQLYAEAKKKAATGGTTFEWQSKLNDQSNTLFGNLAQAGMLTGGQGLDPGGQISKALQGVGIQWQQPPSQATPYAPWAQSIGMNLQVPQLAGAAPQQAAPWAQQVAQGAAQGGPPVIKGMTAQQIMALHPAAQAGVAPAGAAGLPTSADAFTFSPVVQAPPVAAVGAGTPAVPVLAGRR